MIMLSRIIQVLLALLWAGPCLADDIQFALGQRMLGLTDAYRPPNQSDGLSDGIYRLAPEVRVSGANEYFGYEAYYAPIYSQYIRASSRSGLDHFAGATMNIRVTPADRVNLAFQFRDIQGNRTNIEINPDGSTELVNSNLGKTLHIGANLRYEHSLSARTQLIGSLNYQEYDYTNIGNTDNRSLGATAQVQHSLSRRLLLGANVSANYRVFLSEQGEGFRYQTTFNPNAVLRYLLNPSWQISATAGPRVIFTRQRELSGFGAARFSPGRIPGVVYGIETCTPYGSSGDYRIFYAATGVGCGLIAVPAGFVDAYPNYLTDAVFVPLVPNANSLSGNSDNVTYFMQASIRRETPQLLIELAYQRREDASQGSASSTFLDVVFLNVLREVGPRWKWRFNSGWNRRVSTYFQPFYFVLAGANADFPTVAESQALGVQQIETFYETSQVWAEAQVSYKVLENATLEFRLRYERWLKLDLTTGPRPTFDNLTGQVGFKYYFDPIFF